MVGLPIPKLKLRTKHYSYPRTVVYKLSGCYYMLFVLILRDLLFAAREMNYKLLGVRDLILDHALGNIAISCSGVF